MYVAPEVLTGKYNEKCDEWSAGVLLYTLLTGFPPFQGREPREILMNVKKGAYNVDVKEYRVLSSDAKDLISALLTMDPNARVSAQEALKHPWFEKTLKQDDSSQDRKNIVENLKKYRADRKIQQTIFYYFSHFLALQEEKEKLMQVFRSMDKDSNGTLTKEEIIEALKKNKSTLQDAEKSALEIIEYSDMNKNNTIDYSEFVAATIQKEKLLNVEKIGKVFKMFDKVKIVLFSYFLMI